MTEPTVPTLRVVSGSPTPEELAVVTALVAAAAGGAGDEPASPTLRGTWSDPARRLRYPLHPGPNAWRSSAW
jgi:Acyl-CoA carboxylase epsilon subunit